VDPSFHPKFLVEAGGNDDASETTPLLDGAEQGEPLDRDELRQILSQDPNGSLSNDQRKALLGKGSGLERWGRGRISVYNQGDQLVICDEAGECFNRLTLTSGNVSVRKITKRSIV
jgi:hypothetical protein